jgi:predicted RNA-binding Zn ribbon-like protein
VPVSIRNGQPRPKTALDPAFPRLLGERLSLDFANTVEDPAGPRPQEFLNTYADLVRWGRHAGTLTEHEAAALLTEGERRPAVAAAVLAQGLALREAIDRVFHALARDARPGPEDLARIQGAYVAALARGRIEEHDGTFAWGWRDASPPALERVLWPVARSAIELLVSGDRARIKECPPEGGGCTWLFYDTSKNRSRRWCSMEGCGSQVKMRRYQARRRAERA